MLFLGFPVFFTMAYSIFKIVFYNKIKPFVLLKNTIKNKQVYILKQSCFSAFFFFYEILIKITPNYVANNFSIKNFSLSLQCPDTWTYTLIEILKESSSWKCIVTMSEMQFNVLLNNLIDPDKKCHVN